MALNNLTIPEGSRKKRTRKARGPASGLGKTAGRGHKGQKSRSGGQPQRGFEGGQMPLFRRIPKRGFHNLFSKNITALNVRDLNRFEEGTEVTPELLQSLGLVGKIQDGIKILGSGEMKRKLTVSAHFFSKTAIEKIEGAGGSAVKLEK